ncbi:MAG: hypothetical protein NC408_04615 [Candidatus Gastranaerophilales bacterium]|nr:hypothetical protein [Candidatus Gastranaerophilales bacterium]MCM1072245.1 hypothetical protein [Bacteroides sp.]
MGANNNRYKNWNYTTAMCFKNKGRCAECNNNLVCSNITPINKNDYGIHPAKYAMLKTYALSAKPYTTGLKISTPEEGWIL